MCRVLGTLAGREHAQQTVVRRKVLRQCRSLSVTGNSSPDNPKHLGIWCDGNHRGKTSDLQSSTMPHVALEHKWCIKTHILSINITFSERILPLPHLTWTPLPPIPSSSLTDSSWIHPPVSLDYRVSVCYCFISRPRPSVCSVEEEGLNEGTDMSDALSSSTAHSTFPSIVSALQVGEAVLFIQGISSQRKEQVASP